MPKIMGLQRGVTSVVPNTPSILVEMVNEFGGLQPMAQSIALILAPDLTYMRGSGNFLRVMLTFDS